MLQLARHPADAHRLEPCVELLGEFASVDPDAISVLEDAKAWIRPSSVRKDAEEILAQR